MRMFTLKPISKQCILFVQSARIVEGFASKLVPPSASEGFSAVHTVRSFEDAWRLLWAWGWQPPVSAASPLPAPADDADAAPSCAVRL